MSKYVDLGLFNSRSMERNQAISDGKYMEALDEEGRTPESIKEAARKLLGLGEDGIIRLEAESIVMQQNVKAKAFVALTNFTAKAAEGELLTAEETEAVNKIQERLAKEFCLMYDIDIEDLYINEDDEGEE